MPDHTLQTILLLKGLPCSGKSSLADALSKSIQWPVIDKDDGRDCLSVLESTPQAELNALSYDIMFHFAARQVSNGLSVIVDCPLSRSALAEKFVELAQQHAANMAVVECEMKDEECWRQRLTLRAQNQAGTDQSHKPHSWEALQNLIAGYGGSHLWMQSTDGPSQLGKLPVQFHYFQVDMSHLGVNEATAKVVAWMQQTGLLISL